MTTFDDLSFSATDFCGRVRLFPLPNLVMFPNVMQPLHVFEPRYREMVADALAGDRLIAMGLLQAGWESDYEGRPAIAPVACLGKIATHVRQPDGEYNIMLMGLKRVRLTRELAPQRSFREAEVELFDDLYPAAGLKSYDRLRRELVSAYRPLMDETPGEYDQLEELFQSDLPLGMLTDVVSYTLDLNLDVKQRLLAEPNVERRAKTLVQQLRTITRQTGPAACEFDFPPRFSRN